jgi:streptogramin lyase
MKIDTALRRFAPTRRVLPLGLAFGVTVLTGYLVFQVIDVAAPADTAAQGRTGFSGTGNVTGSVTSTRPFKAAQVYLTNTDKGIGYMVYTAAGRFRAKALLPGNYEVTVKTSDQESDVQKVAIGAGDNPALKLAMRDATTTATAPSPFTGGASETGSIAGRTEGLTFQSYDEIYPEGPGKKVAEELCMRCHGENFFPSQPSSEAQWTARVDYMQGKDLHDRDATTYAQGLLSFRTTFMMFSRQDKADLISYLVKNFGPSAPRRGVKFEGEVPLDEAALGKAMYIEYYLPPDPPGEGAKAPDFINIGYRGRRVGQDVRFDDDGNVWLVDRGFPHRLVKLDPRTGVQKAFVLPDPKNGIHEVMIDRSGMIWLPEHRGTQNTATKRILMFNPKTEKFEKMWPGDPDNVIRNPTKFMQSLAIDSKDNLYVIWIMGSAITRFDRATGKATVFRLPSPHQIPYGVVADRNDNIWIATWSGGTIIKFDTSDYSFTQFTAPTGMGHVRRLNVDYQNNIWWGIYSAGRRPGVLVKLDQTTGKMTEYKIPLFHTEPYDVAADPDNNIWFADSPTPDRAALIGKFNTRTQQFTFYPKPQFAADTPKIQVTREGAVWFSPRGSQYAPAISVLYPDMDKMTTLGAYYVNGAPGYPFKVNASTRSR